jgi:hypothetical protein
MKHLVETLMEYAIFLGAKRINELPGLWENKINNQWTIKCNGHTKDILGVPPFSWYVEYNGLPAGILSIMGDWAIPTVNGLNEESLQKAIKRKMRPDYLQIMKNKTQNLLVKKEIKPQLKNDTNQLSVSS